MATSKKGGKKPANAEIEIIEKRYVRLWDVPMGTIEKTISLAARGLPRKPRDADKKPCNLYNRSEADPYPECAGVCESGGKCKLSIVCKEGSWSDLFNIIVSCEC